MGDFIIHVRGTRMTFEQLLDVFDVKDVQVFIDRQPPKAKAAAVVKSVPPPKSAAPVAVAWPPRPFRADNSAAIQACIHELGLQERVPKDTVSKASNVPCIWSQFKHVPQLQMSVTLHGALVEMLEEEGVEPLKGQWPTLYKQLKAIQEAERVSTASAEAARGVGVSPQTLPVAKPLAKPDAAAKPAAARAPAKSAPKPSKAAVTAPVVAPVVVAKKPTPAAKKPVTKPPPPEEDEEDDADEDDATETMVAMDAAGNEYIVHVFTGEAREEEDGEIVGHYNEATRTVELNDDE